MLARQPYLQAGAWKMAGWALQKLAWAGSWDFSPTRLWGCGLGEHISLFFSFSGLDSTCIARALGKKRRRGFLAFGFAAYPVFLSDRLHLGSDGVSRQLLLGGGIIVYLGQLSAFLCSSSFPGGSCVRGGHGAISLWRLRKTGTIGEWIDER
ncbi:hypothetical protein B0T25DRAFT_122461 [Lasiosphaeria hispida]|uniref:Uncharacterized protein n=1 Tax=Lasiosphaeria hispida TaxID=260671 RepID=A0AAJ0HRU4_9PEZI|nr:hypothetical protein B0T25DRAFT_122461 [Lasiosphaeria hispida]